MKNTFYFENIGLNISKFNDIKEALKFSNLDYTVESQNIYLKNGNIIPNKYANVRTDNNSVLGIVGKNYKIVQNINGFNFINKLIENGFKLISAGPFDNGIGVFIILEYNSININNEDYHSFIMVTNNFDGSGTIKVEFTPVRKNCQSVLLLTDKNISTKISIKHCKQNNEELLIIDDIINELNKYINFLSKRLYNLNLKATSIDDLNKIINELIPINEKMSNILKLRAETTRDEIIAYYNSLNLEDTAYKILLAVANYESHRVPLRDTGNAYIYIDRVIDNMLLTNEAFRIINKRLF